MVASWLKDEAVNQQVLVLVGKQGIYKTTWLEHLLPPQLRAYGCKMANSTQLNKDERLRIAEYGLIALDEIDAMGAKELNVMKSVITASEISDKLVIKGSIKKPMPLNRLGMVLQAAGYKSKRISHGKIRGWVVRERDAEEINANRNLEGKGG